MVIVAPSKVAFQDWNDIPGAIVFICCYIKGLLIVLFRYGIIHLRRLQRMTNFVTRNKFNQKKFHIRI